MNIFNGLNDAITMMHQVGAINFHITSNFISITRYDSSQLSLIKLIYLKIINSYKINNF